MTDEVTAVPSAATEASDAAAVCGVPAFDVLSVRAYQTDVVRRLAGADDIVPGTRLPDRATASRRDIVRQYLSERLADAGLTPRLHTYATGANVYAELPSTSGASEWLVLGAHFDTVARSPGANDNATGVALVAAAARYLATAPCRARNIAFVFFDQEEIGLVGSKAFATKLAAEGVSVRAVHTIDQLGWDANGDRLIELERPDVGLADAYRDAVGELGVSVPIVVTSTATSDHSAFRPRFPAVGITEGYRSGNTSPDYHRPTDTADKVDFEYLAFTTRIVSRVFMGDLRTDR